MAQLLLKHIYPNEVPDQKFYFYEGECDVHFGVIELPLDPAFEHWAIRAWIRGYRINPATGELLSRDELVAIIQGTPLPEAETPVVEAETPEGDVNGEQVEDGLAVELEGDAKAGVPESEGEGTDEATEGPAQDESPEPEEVRPNRRAVRRVVRGTKQ